MNVEIITNVFLISLLLWLIVFASICIKYWDTDLSKLKLKLGLFTVVLYRCLLLAVIVSGVAMVLAWIWG